ncbi:Na/Pi cotransporter family protein [Bacillus idriensis]|uniref:Na/Pi cotransporter family protein n=1 Tax=Metabacillus idriensis TaxID=324768 RepID=A0A6I2MFR6_9BACI|nr:Na/Pi symporter [Metabacillus idriensis]MRX55952.1 Na/Pi cotransporter family protein [Metabacillus idriensis]
MGAAGFFLLYLIVFLAGMHLLKKGLSILSGHAMRNWIYACINHPVKAFMAGIIFTGILQSSSAVMVIVIGLVSAGVISFKQTIGIILGTNIGSTFTTQLITLDIGSLILPLFIIGFLCFFMGVVLKKEALIRMCAAFMGLGALFSAMSGFGRLAYPLSQLGLVNELLLYTNEHSFAGVISGTLLTAIIHSSAATVGIIMSFLNADILTLSAGIAYVLGANIGTCITGWMAAAAANQEAKLTAYAHIWVNVIGAAAFYPFISVCSAAVQNLSSQPDLQLAHFSLIFNVISSLALLPFANAFGSFVVSFSTFFSGK